MKFPRPKHQAFTVFELLVVVLIVALLVALQLPAWAMTKVRSERLQCGDNLKRVGVAFQTWASSHNDRLPMSVSGAQGGAVFAVGVVAQGATFASNAGKGVFSMFAVMSNELATPKVLYCPAEYRADYSFGLIFGNSTTNTPGFYSDRQTSYFVGVDANLSMPAMLLSGDHNLGDSGNPPAAGQLYGNVKSNFISAGTNANWGATAIGWANNQHRQEGNVLLLDGSVQQFTTPEFRQALNRADSSGRFAGVFALATGSFGTGVNRLQFP